MLTRLPLDNLIGNVWKYTGRIVERHGGRRRAHGGRGQGAPFCFTPGWGKVSAGGTAPVSSMQHRTGRHGAQADIDQHDAMSEQDDAAAAPVVARVAVFEFIGAAQQEPAFVVA